MNIDDAISAEIDGQFDVWATDVGLDPDAARIEMQSHPQYSTRKRWFEKTRQSLGADVPPLDELTRRKLVSEAMREADAAKRAGFRVPYVAVAAVLLLFVFAAGGFVVMRNGAESKLNTVGAPLESDSALSSDAASEPTLYDYEGYEFGDVSNTSALRETLKGPAATFQDDQPTSTEILSGSSDSRSQTAKSGAEQAEMTTFVQSPAGSICDDLDLGAGIFSGSGSFEGDSVTVFGAYVDGRLIVYLIDDTCTIRSSQSF